MRIPNLGPELIDFSPISQIGERFTKFFQERADEAEKRDAPRLLADWHASQQSDGTPIKNIAQPPAAQQQVAPRQPDRIGMAWNATGGVTAQDPGGNPSRWRDAIASIESKGSGDYAAIGPAHPTLGRALGKYQVMEANIGPWTKQALGFTMTPEQFLADPRAQDRVFDTIFGDYATKTGSERDAASMWFTGKPEAEGANRRDAFGTSGADYVQKFNTAMGGGAPSAQAPVHLAQASNVLPQSRAQQGLTPIQVEKLQRLMANKYTAPFAVEIYKGLLTKKQFSDPFDYSGAVVQRGSDGELKILLKPDEVGGKTGDIKNFEYSRKTPGFEDYTERQGRAKATQVNVGEKGYDQTIGKAQAERFIEIQKAGRDAGKTLNTVRLMDGLTRDPNFYSGTGGPAVAAANKALVSLGIKDAAASSAQEVFQALGNQLVIDASGGSLGAQISNTDREFILVTGPNLSATPEGNRQLLQIRGKLAEREQQVAKMAREYAAKNGGRIDAAFDEQIAAWAEANPLFPKVEKPAGRPQAPAAPSRGEIEQEMRRRGLLK